MNNFYENKSIETIHTIIVELNRQSFILGSCNNLGEQICQHIFGDAIFQNNIARQNYAPGQMIPNL